MSQSERDRYELLRAGERFTDAEAEKAERIAATEPDNIDIQTQLLGYYFRGKWQRVPSAKEKHLHLVLELIESKPALPVLGLPQAMLDPISDPAGYAKAKLLWEKQVATHQDNARVLANAARFYFRSDKGLVEELLKKAQELEPTNPEWTRELAHHYRRGIHRRTGPARLDIAAKSLEQFELAVKQFDDPRSTYGLLEDLAAVAFEADELGKAKQYADRLLELSTSPEFERRTGNAVHHGNLVLGRLALKAGEMDRAKSYLLEAGRTTGSPQLNSFGPNMMLAKELLEHGEKDIVLEYFQLCGKFWEREELDEWAKVIKAGGAPDFGANLRY